MAAVMLIVFVSIAVLGVTTFIVQRFKQYNAEGINTSCIYLAQAGVQNALYFYRFRDLTANGYFTLGQTNIDSNNFFVLGGTDADMLMVNTSTSALGGTKNRDLLNLRMQNATGSRAITIDRMVVTWNNKSKLQGIGINGSTSWAGNLSSPANTNITDFTLNTTPTIYNINFLRFNGDMTGATISIQFIMTDDVGSSRSLTVFPASNNYNFTLQATGKTAGADIYRSISADYNALTAKIINYREVNNEIKPTP